MRRQDLVFIILILCTWCALSTELLSALHSITFTGVLLAWIPPAVAGGWYLFRHFPPPKDLFRRFTSHWIPPFLLLVLLFSLLIGILYPPNNYDSMTYHMGRVAHWIQNKSIAFYPTHIGRQLNYQPFAEWIILHIQILTGGDRLANTVQLFFFAGGIVVITLIIQELGGSRRTQLLGAFLTGMIPMAIAQSNTTQNDVVGAYFVLCFAWCTLVLRRQESNATRVAVLRKDNFDLLRRWSAEMEKHGAKFEDVRELVAGARGKQVYATGDWKDGIWSAGQVQGLIHDIPSCEELISRMVREAEEIITGRLSRFVTPRKMANA